MNKVFERLVLRFMALWIKKSYKISVSKSEAADLLMDIDEAVAYRSMTKPVDAG